MLPFFVIYEPRMFELTLAGNNGAIFFEVITLALPAFELFRFGLGLLCFFCMQFVGSVMLVAIGILAVVGCCLVHLKGWQGVSSGSLKADDHLSNVL